MVNMANRGSETSEFRDHQRGTIKVFGKARSAVTIDEVTSLPLEPTVEPDIELELAPGQEVEPPLPIENPPYRLEHPLELKVRELAAMIKFQKTIPDEEFPEPQAFSILDGSPSKDIALLLADKTREFHFLGYEHVSAEQIWTYFQQLKKRRPRSLHELVNAILVLQPQAIMNFDLQAAYRNTKDSIEDILNDLR
jgi:hypothetical protein